MGQDATENSYYSESHVVSDDDLSSCESNNSSHSKAPASWEKFDENPINKEDAEQDGREKVDTDVNFMSLR